MERSERRYARGIVWFRNDLRVHDNEALHTAAESCTYLVCVYHIPSRYRENGYGGIPRFGAKRARFLRESLLSLRHELAWLGMSLTVTDGSLLAACARFMTGNGIEAVFFHDEAGPEEADDAAIVTAVAHKRGLAVHRFFGSSLYHPDDLPWAAHEIPDVYTTYRKQVETRSPVRAPLPAPRRRGSSTPGLSEAGELPQWFDRLASQAPRSEQTAFPFAGGERASSDRLQSYLWQTDRIAHYKETRNGLLGTEYSSKLSPWLATGALSPRTVYAELSSYEEARVKNDSTYWLVFELIWRDFYIFQMLKHGARMFGLHGPFGKDRTWHEDDALMQAWKTGRTGVPFVDAGMRELALSGYMSNRIRQNCASFLSNNLNLDWRLGAQWFESQLLDYDVSSNWGNWAYNSRVGCDPRDRFFDVVGQGERYDPGGDFVASWVPELAGLPGSHRHRPWEHRLETTGYPQPVIDLEESYERLRRESRKS